MRARGKLARLEVLEAREAERVEEVRARNWAHIEAAEARLPPADRAAWRDASHTLGSDPDAVARLARACAHLPDLPDLPHPAKKEAEAWADVALDVPEGCPLIPPPAGRAADFADYFEACAAWCDAEAVRVPLSPDAQRVARWGAALWRFQGTLCRVLGGAA